MEGSLKTFEQHYDEHVASVYRFTLFKVGDPALAEDIVSETFIRLWKRLSAGEVLKYERSLMYTICTGLIVDHYRKKGTHQTKPLDLIDESLFAQQDEGIAEIETQSTMQTVIRGMNTLVPEHRELLLLHYMQGLPIRDIATIQKKRENTVRVQLHRALKQLKEVLQKTV